MPCAWIACTSATESWPARYGSSPKYSKLRPLRGTRVMFTPGASIRCSPRSATSCPAIVPKLVAAAVFHAADIASAEGSAVAGCLFWLSPGPAPAGPFVILNTGIPRRSTPATSRGCSGTSSMWIWVTFSSSVIAWTSNSARSTGARAVFIHGRSAGAALPTAAGMARVAPRIPAARRAIRARFISHLLAGTERRRCQVSIAPDESVRPVPPGETRGAQAEMLARVAAPAKIRRTPRRWRGAGTFYAMTEAAEAEARPARRRAPAVTVASWLVVGGFAVWALVRVFGLEGGYPFAQLVSFTPYVAGAAVLVPPGALLLRRWPAAAGAAGGAAGPGGRGLARAPPPRREAPRRAGPRGGGGHTLGG